MADSCPDRIMAFCGRFAISVLVCVLAVITATAEEPDAAFLETISNNLRKIAPDVIIDDIRETEVPGLYELRIGMDILYVSMDGRFALRGDLYDLEKQANVSEGRRELLRSWRFRDLSHNEWIEFAPEKENIRHTIYVFTDVNCSYCQRMHQEIRQINDLGITVRYLAFPIIGDSEEARRSMEAVWCNKDRHKALTLAKNGQKIAYRSCVNPVSQMHQLGLEIGVRGTPAIYLPDGRSLPGYMPPDELLDRLQKAG